jgi:hypothetical protein
MYSAWDWGTHWHQLFASRIQYSTMEYKASTDALVKGITIGVFLLFIVLGKASVMALIFAKGDTTTILIHSGILLLFVAILLGSWLFAPQSYLVTGTELIINRRIGKVKFALTDLKEVRLLSPDEMKGTFRTFGTGGLFGYFGKFYIPGIGHSTFYTTQRKNKILIETSDSRKIIITPDDAGMVEYLKI